MGRDHGAAADPSAQGVVLTSALTLADAAVFDVVEAFVEDRLDPGVRALGAAEGAVAYAPGPNLPAEVTARLDELLGQLASGEIQVPTEP